MASFRLVTIHEDTLAIYLVTARLTLMYDRF